MVFRGICLAYVICVFPGVALAQSDRARDVAECGFLAHVAVEQMKKRAERPAVFDDVVRDVVGLTRAYYLARDMPIPHTGPGISSTMLKTVVNAGHAVHARRVRGISAKNALLLSNRVLETCRLDFALFAQKDLAQ